MGVTERAVHDLGLAAQRISELECQVAILLEACTFAFNIIETVAYGDTADGQEVKKHLSAAIRKASQ